MFRTTFSIWLRAAALALALTISLGLQAGSASLNAANGSPAAEGFMVTDGLVNAASGQTTSDAHQIGDARLPTAGPMIFTDLKDVEEEARTLLATNRAFRRDISPHQGTNNFDDLVRQFDIEAGFTTDYSETATLGEMIDNADTGLRQARDLYAYLAVYADEERFRTAIDCGADEDDPFADEPKIDWCNFAARIRESLREAAYVRMIFGQQFTADAFGFRFGANIVGGDDFVNDEVRKLEMAEEQFLLAREAVAEGLDHDLGNGCYIYDFYSDAEWALLSRAVEGLERARHHMAVRKSYLAPDPDSWPAAQTQAQTIMQKAAADQYIDLAMLAGLVISQSPCERGTRPDNEHVAEMSANLMMTQESAREMGAGRNIFGFDVSFTPARPYRTAPGSQDTGLWEQAEYHALQAKDVQDDVANTERTFDLQKTKLLDALRDVKEKYDLRLGDYTGCSTGWSDDDFFACVDAVADGLRVCDPTVENEANYLTCVGPYGGQLREEWDHLREASLEIKRTQQELENLTQRQVVEMERNATVTSEILTNGQEQAALELLATLLDSFSVSASFGIPDGFSVSVSSNPFQPVIAAARYDQVLRQAVSDMRIENANSEAAVRNLLLDAVELQRQLEIDAHKAHAQVVVFENLASGTADLAVEARRARAYVAQSPANDPSFRLVRDSNRLQLAEQLELAARTSYLAAKRAEYEYAARLNVSGAPVSTIYQARTAQDVIAYLAKLKNVTDNLVIHGSEVHREEFTLSMAQHVLGWTDEALGLTGDAAREERIRLFREWVAEHTENGASGDPELHFRISTSPADNGVFSTAIAQVYDRYWLQKVTGVGLPNDDNSGLGMNLITPETGLGYRRVVVKQAGVVHLKARTGCTFDYRLIHPAALLGLEWPEGQPTDVAADSFHAAINGQNGTNTGAFLGRPVSATDWEVIVKAGAPGDPGLSDMDLQQLEDIELIFDSTHGDRDPGAPKPDQCVRVDY